ncbi:MAG: hypothetical protein ACLGJC_05400 [Alphaproteobacteria bacterium]
MGPFDLSAILLAQAAAVNEDLCALLKRKWTVSALVLSLPESQNRGPILAVCYAAVAFSILVQGLTLEPIGRRLMQGSRAGTGMELVP